MNDAEKLSWLRLSRSGNVGPITFYRLLSRFKTATRALEALPELSARGGRQLKPYALNLAEEEVKKLTKMGGQFICANEDSYPLALSAIHDAPPVLSVLGDPSHMQHSCVGIIGSRNASLNGRKFAHKLSRDLGEHGHIVVSGLARGIDTSAHEGALEHGTIAVVAGGLDHIYPKENTDLFHQIAQKGAVIAENGLGVQPTAQLFPRRNRIVSGLSAGVVVVEANKKSGSLITARMAAEQGRDVFAVPGSPMDPRAAGPNSLIRDGAIMVETVADILDHIANFKASPTSKQGLSENVQDNFLHEDGFEADIDFEETPENEREKVISNLSHLPVTVDEIVRSCHVSITGIQNVLLELELAGRLQRLPGNRVALIEE